MRTILSDSSLDLFVSDDVNPVSVHVGPGSHGSGNRSCRPVGDVVTPEGLVVKVLLEDEGVASFSWPLRSAL